MAQSYPIDRRYKVTTVDDGKLLILGDVSEQDGGFWRIHFVPDATWVGGLDVLSRASGPDAGSDLVGFGTTAYRRVQIGGVAADPSVLVQVGNPAVPLVDTDFIIYVPASGLSIAIGATVTTGYGYLYTQPLRGLSN